MKAHLLERPFEDGSRGGVELRLHHVRHQVEHVDLESAVQQPLGGFEAQQSAANDDRACRCRGALEDAAAVVERPEAQRRRA